MATITVRNLPEETKRDLKIRAARAGVSLEQEVRTILNNSIGKPFNGKDLGKAINDLFKSVGGTDDVPVYTRLPLKPPIDFST